MKAIVYTHQQTEEGKINKPFRGHKVTIVDFKVINGQVNAICTDDKNGKFEVIPVEHLASGHDLRGL